MASAAMFGFRKECDNCYSVADFVASFATACGKDVVLLAMCNECGALELVRMNREDFLLMFCGGE